MEAMKKLFNKENILPLCFLLLPFMIILLAMPLNSGVTIHTSHHFAIFIFGVVMVTMFTKNKWISAFLIYACIWTLFILLYTVKHPQVPAAVIKNAFDALTFFMVGALIYTLIIKSKITTETFVNLICISALVQAAIALCQYFWIDPFLWAVNTFFHPAIQKLDPHALTGTLGNNNFLAAYMAISLPFFFRFNNQYKIPFIVPSFTAVFEIKKINIHWFYGLFLIVPCLVLGNTTSAFIPAAIGTLYFFWNRREFTFYKLPTFWIAFNIIGIIALYYAFVYHPFIHSPRWEFWATALKQVFDSPFSLICGFGPGAGWGQPFPMHNEWLQCLHQYGLIGLALMIGYVLTAYKGNRMLFTAFGIALINMFGNYSLHLAPSAFLIIVICGLMEREEGHV